MSWNEIAAFGATVRPLSSVRPPAGNAYSRFRAPLSQTLELRGTSVPYEDCGDPTCNGICARPGAAVSVDEIVESIRAICAPLPECRALRDKIIAEVERLERDNQLLQAALAATALAGPQPVEEPSA